jgi:hypothetical protein
MIVLLWNSGNHSAAFIFAFANCTADAFYMFSVRRSYLEMENIAGEALKGWKNCEQLVEQQKYYYEFILLGLDLLPPFIDRSPKDHSRAGLDTFLAASGVPVGITAFFAMVFSMDSTGVALLIYLMLK